MLVRMNRDLAKKIVIMFTPETNEEMAHMETYMLWLPELSREIAMSSSAVGTGIDYMLEVK